MGQAKRRGSFEERKAQAQAREHERRQREVELKERQEAQERFDALPQAEKDALIAQARRRRSVAPFLLFALGLSALD